MAGQTVTQKIFDLIVAADHDGTIERGMLDKTIALRWSMYFRWSPDLSGEVVAYPDVPTDDDGSGPSLRLRFSFDDLLMFADDDKPAVIAAMRSRLDEIEGGLAA